jgi:hypothetical protein
MIRSWRLIVFLAALAVSAVALAPARLFVRQQPGALTYASADGTIWRARFGGVRFGPFDAGDVAWRLSFKDLVQGKMIARIDMSGGEIVGDAAVLGNWRGDRRLVAHSLHLTGAPVTPTLRLAGVTTVGNLDLLFRDGRCAAAQGALFSDVLVRTSSQWRWQGPQLRGTAICVDEAARLDLSGSSESGSVRAALDLAPDGRGVWRIEVRTSRPEVGVALRAAGFGPGPQDFRLSREVRWSPF